MSESGDPSSPLFRLRGVRKSFGATVALAGVDFEAEAGQVHAILGRNGAGKSTLMGILGGAERPDAGSMFFAGQLYAPTSPREARTLGVGMVHQELCLCPHLTVAENIMLGREPSRRGTLDSRQLTTHARGALEAVAGRQRARAVPLTARVGDLSIADRQLVEIARALADERCRVLILDEPTSSLGRDEVRILFERVRAMRARGLSILYISHSLEEVREIADRFTVLRDGLSVAAGNVADVSNPEWVTAMAGKPVSLMFGRSTRAPGEVVLACSDVGGTRLPVRASFELRRGEVLGIAGVIGSGRTELLRVLFGLDDLVHGSMLVLGHEGRGPPAARIRAGVGMLSEDRKAEGLALPMGVADNLMLSRLPNWVCATWQALAVRGWVTRLGVRCRDLREPVHTLSGGNQQKIALGRLLYQDAQVLLLDQPGRGVDVAAKADVHRVIDELATVGRAVLVVSDDLVELLGVCDRIAVMRGGVLGEAKPVTYWTEASLLAESVGACDEVPS